jgi:hypothetical protein
VTGKKLSFAFGDLFMFEKAYTVVIVLFVSVPPITGNFWQKERAIQLYQFLMDSYHANEYSGVFYS